MAFDLIVNGTRHTIDADPQTPLLWVIRDHVGLTGTKFSCGIGQCGACTRARRWPRRPLLQRPRGHGHRQADHDDRRRLAGRQPSDSDRLEGIRYAAVRLLPVRHDHERARAAAAAPESYRRRHQRAGDERLPMRHVSPRPAGDPPGRRSDEGGRR